MCTGAVPFVLAYHYSQAYCKAHPERMMHVVNDWRMVFHPELVPESFGMLNARFAWLFPVLPEQGGLAFLSLGLLAAWHIRLKNRAMAVGIAGSIALIVLSFAFAKTHDGTWSFLYPNSRMYLALPLLLCWCLAALPGKPVCGTATLVAAVIACAAMVGIKYSRAEKVIATHLAWPDLPMVERPVATLERDLHLMTRLCGMHDIQLIVGTNDVQGPIPARFRCFLYPALESGLPPTYLYGMERRFWQRDAVADSVFQRILVLGAGASPMDTNALWEDLSSEGTGPLFLITGNRLPTDRLMATYLQLHPGR